MKKVNKVIEDTTKYKDETKERRKDLFEVADEIISKIRYLDESERNIIIGIVKAFSDNGSKNQL